jgi:putative transposase
MTMPRQILPGTTYLIQRRCTQRQFLLKPGEKTNQIVQYCFAVAAEKYEVLLHSLDVLSNHYHAEVTDTLGNLPDFLAYVNRLIAACLNASLRRWENFWATEQPCVVKLVSDEDKLRKMVYSMANPVSSYLVSHSHMWPGVGSTPKDLLSDGIDVHRPEVFFRENGKMPAKTKLKLVRPPGFDHLSDEEFVALLEKELEKREAEIREHAKANTIRFLGVRRILRQRHTDTPTSRAPRRKLKPRVAAVNKWRRIEALQRLKAFLVAYREAWLQ